MVFGYVAVTILQASVTVLRIDKPERVRFRIFFGVSDACRKDDYVHNQRRFAFKV